MWLIDFFSQYNLYNMLKCNMQLGNKFEPNNFHLLARCKEKATKSHQNKEIQGYKTLDWGMYELFNCNIYCIFSTMYMYSN